MFPRYQWTLQMVVSPFQSALASPQSLIETIYKHHWTIYDLHSAPLLDEEQKWGDSTRSQPCLPFTAHPQECPPPALPSTWNATCYVLPTLLPTPPNSCAGWDRQGQLVAPPPAAQGGQRNFPPAWLAGWRGHAIWHICNTRRQHKWLTLAQMQGQDCALSSSYHTKHSNNSSIKNISTFLFSLIQWQYNHLSTRI